MSKRATATQEQTGKSRTGNGTKAPRESNYVKVARLAYQVTQASLPLYSHAKSPHRFTLPQLAACVLLSFYINRSYRDTEELLLAADGVCRVLELKSVPNYSTLSRTYKKLTQADWQRMLEVFLAAVNDGQGVEEAYVAIDSTYFAPTQASLHYITRSGRTYQNNFKGVYAVGTQSQFILAMRSGLGTANDAPYLAPLRRSACHCGVLTAQGRRSQTVLADKGFDGRGVIRRDLVPPIRRGGKLVAPQRRAKLDQVSQARLDGLYGQRWKVETVNSVIKRKFGSAVRSRRYQRQLREALVRALVYNIHVLLCLLRLWLFPPLLTRSTPVP
jgi:hypothetical protein